MLSKGAKALRGALASRGAKAELTRRLNVPHYKVSHWMSGKYRPLPEERDRLEALFGIPYRYWDSPCAEKETAA